MRYFNHLSQADLDALFFQPPAAFSKTTQREELRSGLGGLLYTPGSNPNIAQLVCNRKISGLTALALCLEDAVGDQERDAAVKNIAHQLALLHSALENGSLPSEQLPLLFLRIKNTAMLEQLAGLLVRHSPVLCGVILPKVTPDSLSAGLALTEDIHRQCTSPFYAMPILESVELMSCPDRLALLHELRSIADRFFDRILNIRVGATDLCGLYGIRRDPQTTIYQVPSIASCITDVVRVFGLHDRYSISGPVWEYFPPAQGPDGQSPELNGLLQEVQLDLQNGFCGKTCAHPAQLLPVQAAYAVPWESYHDALAILNGDQDSTGVLSSAARNKMNELKPHALWSRKILRQARFFGVLRQNVRPRELLRSSPRHTSVRPSLSFAAGDALHLSLDLQHNRFGLSCDDLFHLARRDNPQRPFLFVSKVLGKHLPIRPAALLAAGKLLALALDSSSQPGPWVNVLRGTDHTPFPDLLTELERSQTVLSPDQQTLFVGFAETATGLARAVASCYCGDCAYISTTRSRLWGYQPISFQESHSHAATHWLHLDAGDTFPFLCKRAVLIDDEFTTGNTALHLVESLSREYGISHFVLLSLLDWSDHEKRRQLEQRLSIRIEQISLLQGKIQSIQTHSCPPPILDDWRDCPYPEPPQTILSSDLHLRMGRILRDAPQQAADRNACRAIAEQLGPAPPNTLFLGAGELIYEPTLIAGLCGGESFHSTTQSPIVPLPGSAVENGVHVVPLDWYSPNGFLYQVPKDRYQQAFLLCEQEMFRPQGVCQLADWLKHQGCEKVQVVLL